MHKGYILSLFMFLILMYVLNDKVTNYARIMPYSDHRVYISRRMYDKLYYSLHTYASDESRTFNLKLGYTKELYQPIVSQVTFGTRSSGVKLFFYKLG